MRWRDLPGIVCGVAWGAFGALKLLAPHPRGVTVAGIELGTLAGAAIGVLEICLGVAIVACLQRRSVTRSMWLLSSLALLTVALLLSLRFETPSCGCLGAAVISYRQHLAVLGIMLLLNGSALLLADAAPGPAPSVTDKDLRARPEEHQ
jgi:hypothetical protein